MLASFAAPHHFVRTPSVKNGDITILHMKQFEFIHKKKFSTEELTLYRTIESKWTWQKTYKRLFVLIIVVLLLQSAYTIVLAIAILGFAIFIDTMPKWSSRIGRKDILKSGYLLDELTYGINESSFWVEGEKISAKGKWDILQVWEIKNDWLQLRADGLPTIYLPIQALENAGIYDEVLSLCKKHGTEFDEA